MDFIVPRKQARILPQKKTNPGWWLQAWLKIYTSGHVTPTPGLWFGVDVNLLLGGVVVVLRETIPEGSG